MSDWKQRAAVEIVNELKTIFETGNVPQAEMEAFVINVIAGHLASLADEWPEIETVGQDQMFEMEKVTRVELIDHRHGSSTFGRAFVAWDVSTSVSIQDQGRTMKVLVNAPKSND